MSDQGGLSSEKVSLLPVSPLEAAAKQGQQNNGTEEENAIRDEGRGQEEEEKKLASSAHLEPSTLPWPGDKDGRPQTDASNGAWLGEKQVLEVGDEDVAGFPEKESATKTRSRWRESMPEGERWRDDEVEVQHEGRGDGSLADDEDEGDDEEVEGEKWIPEKAARGFTPEVTIVRPSCKVQPGERQPFIRTDETQLDLDTSPPPPFYEPYLEEDDKYCKYQTLHCILYTRVVAKKKWQSSGNRWSHGKEFVQFPLWPLKKQLFFKKQNKTKTNQLKYVMKKETGSSSW